MNSRFVAMSVLSLLLLAGCAKLAGQSRDDMTTQGTSATRGAGAADVAGGATGAARDGDVTSAAATNPSTARASLAGFKAVSDLNDVYFDVDRYAIRPQDADTLAENARWLVQHPDHVVLIEGHCDERGTTEYNAALGDQRAKAVRNHLLGRGVRAASITVISYGEDRPQCRDASEACWSRNRRARFVVKPR